MRVDKPILCHKIVLRVMRTIMGALEESYHIEDNEDYNIMGHWGRQTQRFSRRINDVAENASNSRNTFDLRNLWNQV